MKINEIFYSIQGEGHFSGTPAVFIRFAGCNLKCPFCDTQHQQGREMSENEIIKEVSQYPAELCVLTGGEPTLQVTKSFIDKLHNVGLCVAIETNGTHEIPKNIDWVTLSPKSSYVARAEVKIKRANEIKFVVDETHLPETYDVVTQNLYIQPCDTGEPVRNRKINEICINYVKQHPQWKISLQMQKILQVR